MLIKQRLDFKLKKESRVVPWNISIARSDFLMKSHLTFHSAALFSIRQELVKQLSFMISYLEQDGIIKASEVPELFVQAKECFYSHFMKKYVQ